MPDSDSGGILRLVFLIFTSQHPFAHFSFAFRLEIELRVYQLFSNRCGTRLLSKYLALLNIGELMMNLYVSIVNLGLVPRWLICIFKADLLQTFSLPDLTSFIVSSLHTQLLFKSLARFNVSLTLRVY